MKEKDSHTKAAHAQPEESKLWSIKKGEKATIEIEVAPQNSFFYSDKLQDNQNAVREPEVLTYSEVEPMLDFLGYNQRDAATFLEVDPGTISRWKRNKNEIGKLRTRNMMEVDGIIAKGIRLFGNEINLKEWLNTTNNALGDAKPSELLKDPYGVAQVEEALDALSWGSYV